jgi:superfamily II DNA or RNA helicase
MTTVSVRALNSVWDQFDVDRDVAMELADHFSYEVAGAQFSPAFKRGHWDGRKKLFDIRNKVLPGGLRDAVAAFCEKNGYRFRELDPRPPGDVLNDDVVKHFDRIKVPAKFERREHQLRTIASAVKHRRRLFLSPTSSGKSMAIYGICRWFDQVKTLVIVPTIGLLKQLPLDFIDYGLDPRWIHTATTKEPDRRGCGIVVSTWQTAVKQDQEWFDQFGMVCGDEAHLFKADSLVEIMGRLTNCDLRFGFTGTLDGSKTNEMVLRGLFGPVEKIITTMELVELGYVARPKVSIIRLKHPDSARMAMHARAAEIKRDARKAKKPGGGLVYAHEIETLAACEARNKFIANLVTKRLEGNTLVLFHREEHGLVLLEEMRRRTNRPVHFINGGVGGLEREDIRQLVMGTDDAILLASTGTTSTGINIPNIRYVVFASPWKSRIVNLQSVGRGLRISEGKTECGVFDVADDLSWKEEQNHTLKHLVERVKIYAEEGFEYQSFPVDLSY